MREFGRSAKVTEATAQMTWMPYENDYVQINPGYFDHADRTDNVREHLLIPRTNTWRRSR